MSSAEALAVFFGGLGLFFLSIIELSASMRRAAGPRIRSLMALAARGPARAVMTGLGIGMLIQSSNAATFVVISLVTAGLLNLETAFIVSAWVNIGPGALVLLTTFDLRLAVLYVLGVIGFANLFGYARGPRLQPIVRSVVALCTALLALSIVKTTWEVLGEADPALLEHMMTAGGIVEPFLVALLLTVLVQSSSTVAIVAIRFAAADILSVDALAFAIYGATIGSGLAILVVGRALRGQARRVVLYQAGLKVGTGLLFTLLFAVEHWGGVPGPIALCVRIAGSEAGGLGVLFLLIQIVGCLVFCSVPSPDRLVFGEDGADHPCRGAGDARVPVSAGG